jgi:hypothetical protein
MPGEHADEAIAAIEYRRVTRRHLLVPHAVFTVRPEKPYWLASIYDFDWCANAGLVCYHNSGSGGAGLHIGQFSEPGKIGVPLWWDSSLIRVGTSPRTLKRWGYKVVPAPLPLEGTPEINPFLMGWMSETKTEYCKHCRSYIPVDSDSPCEHLTWVDENSDFEYREHVAAT